MYRDEYEYIMGRGSLYYILSVHLEMKEAFVFKLSSISLNSLITSNK